MYLFCLFIHQFLIQIIITQGVSKYQSETEISYNNDLSFTFPFWSQGFANLCCDVHPQIIYRKTYFNNSLEGGDLEARTYFKYKSIHNGDVVYVASADLPYFIKNVFSRLSLDTRIILVSGCEDIGVPFELFHPFHKDSHCRSLTRETCPHDFGEFSFKGFILDNRLYKWYTQNLDMSPDGCSKGKCLTNESLVHIFRKKMHPIPIGLDFHSIRGKKILIERKDLNIDHMSQFKDLKTLKLLNIPLKERRKSSILISFDCQKNNWRNKRGPQLCNSLFDGNHDNQIEFIFNLKLTSSNDHQIATTSGIEGNQFKSYILSTKTLQQKYLLQKAEVNIDDFKTYHDNLQRILNAIQSESSIWSYFRLFEVIGMNELGRLKMWLLATQTLFAIVPQGGGIDTHRLWELLHFGCIPIVLSSSLDTLYSEFPIVIINSWEEIHIKGNLDKYYEDIVNRFGISPFKNTTMMQKLSLSYWINQLQYDKQDIIASS